MATKRSNQDSTKTILPANGATVTRRSLEDYVLDPNNLNKGTLRGMSMHEDSIAEFGAARSVVADKNNVLLAGNKTAERLFEAGITDVIEIETDGKQLVVVKRNDLDITTERGQRYAIFDNRTGELNLDWSGAALQALLDDSVDLARFFDGDELDALLAATDDGTPGTDPGPQIDRANELQQKWQVATGDLWTIGKHRLLCGDSTNAADVARVMGADKFRMIWTDPPYGVDYASLEDSRRRAGRTNRRVSSAIAGDQLKPEQIYALVNNALNAAKPYAHPAAGLYVAAPPGPLYLRFAQAIIDAGFSYRQQLVWVKNAPGFGRTDYHYQHEPIIYGWLEGGSHYFIDNHSKVTILEAQKPLHSLEHPTMKPVELVSQMIENSSRHGEVVYEPFAGAGSTLIACEQTGRQGIAISIAMPYCSVILERLAGLGLEPRREA